MRPAVDCYSCEEPAINACKRCAKPYCEDHGNASYCADCLKPASAMPSFNLYRGALLVMLVGTALAVFLLLRPPGESKGAAPVVVGNRGPTPTASGGKQEPTVAPATPGASATAAAAAASSTAGSGTPSAGGTGTAPAGTPGTPGAATTGTPSASGTPTASGTQSPFIEYTAQEGDSLYGIAQQNVPVGDDIVEYMKAVAALNGWPDYEHPDIHVGQIILLPRPAQ